jgi:hypothetical protein
MFVASPLGGIVQAERPGGDGLSDQPGITEGDAVIITESTTVYDNSRQRRMSAGSYGEVIAGPEQYNDETWYKVDGNRIAYWVKADELKEVQDLSFGDAYAVREGTNGYRGEDQVRVPEGRAGQLINGPRMWEDDVWWQLQIQAEGEEYRVWVPDGTLGNYTQETDGPIPGPGDKVRVTRSSTVAYADGWGTVSSDRRGIISRDQIEYSGRTWVQVVSTTPEGQEYYWIVPQDLTITDESPFSTGDVADTDRVQTAWSGGNKTALDRGLRGELTGGPTPYKGQIWWKIRLQTDGKQAGYWVPQRDLSEAPDRSEAMDQFDEDTYVKVTETTTAYRNFGWKLVERGMAGNVTGSPFEYNGKVWFPVEVNGVERDKRYWVPSRDLKVASQEEGVYCGSASDDCGPRGPGASNDVGPGGGEGPGGAN